MALFLRENDVRQLLTMPLALDRVAAAFRYLGKSQITIFGSQGLAVQDLAVGEALVRLARERDMGIELPLAM